VGRQVHGAVDVNALDASAFFEGPVAGGWRVSASVRRSYVDALLPLFIPKKVGSNFVTVVPVYYDYQARAEHDLRGGGKFVLEAFGSDDQLAVVAQDPARVVRLLLRQRSELPLPLVHCGKAVLLPQGPSGGIRHPGRNAHAPGGGSSEHLSVHLRIDGDCELGGGPSTRHGNYTTSGVDFVHADSHADAQRSPPPRT